MSAVEVTATCPACRQMHWLRADAKEPLTCCGRVLERDDERQRRLTSQRTVRIESVPSVKSVPTWLSRAAARADLTEEQRKAAEARGRRCEDLPSGDAIDPARQLDVCTCGHTRNLHSVMDECPCLDVFVGPPPEFKALHCECKRFTLGQAVTQESYEARVERARTMLDEARRKLEDAATEISNIKGLADEWSRIRAEGERVRTLREKFDTRVWRRRASLARLNGGAR